ncbi:hypothetical protein P8452_56841 [Trifolium repens]|nr:hypothetical protein P8452_56841 [Trifolium repens]
MAGQRWPTLGGPMCTLMTAVLMHTGYCRPTASPPPAADIQELRATIRVLHPKDWYISTLRNNIRFRAWGAAIGCSYRNERCCIVKEVELLILNLALHIHQRLSPPLLQWLWSGQCLPGPQLREDPDIHLENMFEKSISYITST